MTTRRRFLMILSVAMICFQNGRGADLGLADFHKTEVLVVGTVHQRHSIDTNFSYKDIFKILSTYDPDVVCVEIRPKEFRKEPYLEEMMLATIWGVIHDKKVYPIDWWLDGARQVRDSLMKLPEYKQKEREVDAIEAKDSIVGNFEKKYGTWKNQGQTGYEFWNGKEYNDYTMEEYRLSMEVFGDSPINLYYWTRNDSMMAYILSAIRENPGRKVIVLTGGEHKHYFDKALRNDSAVSLVQLASILPLTNKEFDPAITSYLEEMNDLPYYETGHPKDMNDYYRTKLIPVIHGPDMDEYPETVPPGNIVKAEKVINRWKKDPSSSTASDIIDFEIGWLHFLKREYHQAIGFLSPLSLRIEAGTVRDPFLRAATHRNLGFCYDCIGKRDSAIVNYRRGEELARGTPFESSIKVMFKNYKVQPYYPR